MKAQMTQLRCVIVVFLFFCFFGVVRPRRRYCILTRFKIGATNTEERIDLSKFRGILQDNLFSKKVKIRRNAPLSALQWSQTQVDKSKSRSEPLIESVVLFENCNQQTSNQDEEPNLSEQNSLSSLFYHALVWMSEYLCNRFYSFFNLFDKLWTLTLKIYLKCMLVCYNNIDWNTVYRFDFTILYISCVYVRI